VTVILGHYVPEPVEEDGKPTGRTKWTEKQTDINVALSVMFDGIDDCYDVAFLLSADTDQVATARMFQERLAPKGKRLIGVAPPGRNVPQGYSHHGVKGFSVTKHQIERCVMPEEVQGPEKLIVRPGEYAPPADWIHPDQRPKVKPAKAPKVWSKGYRG
jgi:predicted ester cyclase